MMTTKIKKELTKRFEAANYGKIQICMEKSGDIVTIEPLHLDNNTTIISYLVCANNNGKKLFQNNCVTINALADFINRYERLRPIKIEMTHVWER